MSSRPDEIPNEVLQKFTDELTPALNPHFRACLKSGHHLKQFHTSITVLLLKMGNDNYYNAFEGELSPPVANSMLVLLDEC